MQVHAFAVGDLDQAEHLDVLFERQRDVEVIDALAADDLVGIAERAEQRQAAVADVIADRAIVDEAEQLEAELAVIEHLVRDHPPEVAGAGNQHPLQADAGLPAPLERFADELARQVGEDARWRRGTAPSRSARPRRRRRPSAARAGSRCRRPACRTRRAPPRGCCRRRPQRSRRAACGPGAGGRAPARGRRPAPAPRRTAACRRTTGTAARPSPEG